MTEKKIARVVFGNIKGKAIVTCGSETYIVPSLGYHKDQEILIDTEKAIKAPSLLFALAMTYEGTFEEAVAFIKENWN